MKEEEGNWEGVKNCLWERWESKTWMKQENEQVKIIMWIRNMEYYFILLQSLVFLLLSLSLSHFSCILFYNPLFMCTNLLFPISRSIFSSFMHLFCPNSNLFILHVSSPKLFFLYSYVYCQYHFSFLYSSFIS